MFLFETVKFRPQEPMGGGLRLPLAAAISLFLTSTLAPTVSHAQEPQWVDQYQCARDRKAPTRTHSFFLTNGENLVQGFARHQAGHLSEFGGVVSSDWDQADYKESNNLQILMNQLVINEPPTSGGYASGNPGMGWPASNRVNNAGGGINMGIGMPATESNPYPPDQIAGHSDLGRFTQALYQGVMNLKKNPDGSLSHEEVAYRLEKEERRRAQQEKRKLRRPISEADEAAKSAQAADPRNVPPLPAPPPRAGDVKPLSALAPRAGDLAALQPVGQAGVTYHQAPERPLLQDRPGDQVPARPGSIMGWNGVIAFTAHVDPRTGQVQRIIYREANSATKTVAVSGGQRIVGEDPFAESLLAHVARMQHYDRCCTNDSARACNTRFHARSAQMVPRFKESTDRSNSSNVGATNTPPDASPRPSGPADNSSVFPFSRWGQGTR